MLTKKKKSEGLTYSQECIWDLITGSKHSLNRISTHSGYSYTGIRNWMNGVCEPSSDTVKDILDSICILELKPPTSINWIERRGELETMKLKGMSNTVIAGHMQTTRLAVERASKRLGINQPPRKGL